MENIIFCLVLLLTTFACSPPQPSRDIPKDLFEYSYGSETRWSSFENPNAGIANGGKENNGAKGHPFDEIGAGQTVTLLDFDGPGIINRIWITIRDRSPQMLRSLKIEVFWDSAEKPAISVPFGDFFGIGLGKTVAFENALFSNPEGRSFNCYIPMPFKSHAKIQITNDSKKRLSMIFYDVNFQKLKEWNEASLYFHTYFNRDTATTLAEDFEILPRVVGKGRYLGTNIGVNSNPIYEDTWWGEGEVKIYLNGDTDIATLVGTGTEDYIGTGWGQGEYNHQFQGCLVANHIKEYAFYRYHIPDPVYFESDCRVTIQQIGGGPKKQILEFLEKGVELIPVTVQTENEFYPLYKQDPPISLDDSNLPEGWTNYYRIDDYSATTYFYLDRPTSNLPEIQNVELRAFGMNGND